MSVLPLECSKGMSIQTRLQRSTAQQVFYSRLEEGRGLVGRLPAHLMASGTSLGSPSAPRLMPFPLGGAWAACMASGLATGSC